MDLMPLHSLQSKPNEGWSRGNLSRVPSNFPKRNSFENPEPFNSQSSMIRQHDSLLRPSLDTDLFFPSYMKVGEPYEGLFQTSNRSAFSLISKRAVETTNASLLVQSDSGENQAVITCSDHISQNGPHKRESSRRRHASQDQETINEELKLSEIAYEMIEKNRVAPRPLRKLNIYQRAFLSNLVYIASGGQSYISPELTLEKFARNVNRVLHHVSESKIQSTKVDHRGNLKIDRKDNKLRWLYKHFISYLLQRETNYTPDKNHRREDYTDTLIKQYFKGSLHYKPDLDTTEFASAKKFKRLFEASPSFKEEFVDFTNNKLRAVSRQEGIHKYQLMYREVLKIYETNGSFAKKPVLAKKRRLHDLELEVEGAIMLLNKVAKN